MVIYLDNSATTRPMDEVVKTMNLMFTEQYFNPSALYKPAVEVYREVSSSRRLIAKALGAQEQEIVFTSGGTECNGLALGGSILRMRHPKVAYSAIEHPSVSEFMAGAEKRDINVSKIGVDAQGYIDLNQLEDTVDNTVTLLSIMHVNNEVGTIQNLKQIAQIAKRRNPLILLHVDGVQAFMKVPLDLKGWGIDLYSTSGHKLHGPKGIGALYVEKGQKIEALQLGGGQERGLRSGTENIPAICGYGKAVALYLQHRTQWQEHLRKLKNRLVKHLNAIEDIFINGPSPEESAPHILNISIMGTLGETVLHALEQKEIYVGLGSACSAKKHYSHTLTAMGLPVKRLESAIRISLSVLNTQEEMDVFADELNTVIRQLRRG